MRNFETLNMDELINVYHCNNKLQELVFNDMVETTDFYISDYLDNFEHGAIDYSLDVSGYYNYMRVSNPYKFINGLQVINCKFELLLEYEELIDYTDELTCKLEYCGNSLSTINYMRLENRIDELCSKLCKALYDRIRKEYNACYDSEYQLEYFLDFYAYERMDDSFYIDDDFVLYEHVEYTKSYA